MKALNAFETKTADFCFLKKNLLKYDNNDIIKLLIKMR